MALNNLESAFVAMTPIVSMTEQWQW